MTSIKPSWEREEQISFHTSIEDFLRELTSLYDYETDGMSWPDYQKRMDIQLLWNIKKLLKELILWEEDLSRASISAYWEKYGNKVKEIRMCIARIRTIEWPLQKEEILWDLEVFLNTMLDTFIQILNQKTRGICNEAQKSSFEKL